MGATMSSPGMVIAWSVVYHACSMATKELAWDANQSCRFAGVLCYRWVWEQSTGCTSSPPARTSTTPSTTKALQLEIQFWTGFSRSVVGLLPGPTTRELKPDMVGFIWCSWGWLATTLFKSKCPTLFGHIWEWRYVLGAMPTLAAAFLSKILDYVQPGVRRCSSLFRGTNMFNHLCFWFLVVIIQAFWNGTWCTWFRMAVRGTFAPALLVCCVGLCSCSSRRPALRRGRSGAWMLHTLTLRAGWLASVPLFETWRSLLLRTCSGSTTEIFRTRIAKLQTRPCGASGFWTFWGPCLGRANLL